MTGEPKEDVEMLILLAAPPLVLSMLVSPRLGLVAAVPCAAAFIIFSVIRRRRWQRGIRPPGYCRRCGYDMRSTPDRCPECGTLAGEER